MSFVKFELFKSAFRKLFRNKNRVFVGELSFLLMIGVMIGFNACTKSNNKKELQLPSSEPCASTFSKSESVIEDTVKSEIPIANKEKKETKKTKLTANEIKKINTVVAARNAVPKESAKPYGNAAPPKSTAAIGSANTIPVNCILQNPELPTGCEATSLTMVLNYWGYTVSKVTIAGQYLPPINRFLCFKRQKIRA